MKLLPTHAPATVLDPIVQALVVVRITPNMLTVAGFLGNVVAAGFVANGELVIGGVLALVFSALDMLDGAVARATGKASPFGAMFDSVLDRLSEAAVLGGILLYELELENHEEAMLAFWAVVGSLMVSYVRARAEGLGIMTMRSGLFTRPERVVVTGVALLFGWLRPALWLLAVVTLLTTVQRLWTSRGLLLEMKREATSELAANATSADGEQEGGLQ
jgi:CDP-diacylglycerol--glycerol-3-phosphate 3-phosphatidyltransferase